MPAPPDLFLIEFASAPSRSPHDPPTFRWEVPDAAVGDTLTFTGHPLRVAQTHTVRVASSYSFDDGWNVWCDPVYFTTTP
jgi:hypothetical protein